MNAPITKENFAPFGEAQGSMLSGPFAPLADESEFADLTLLKGRIPTDLNGVYLRAGPNPRFVPNGRYHPFDGDGMIHAAEFRNGRLTVRNRWVRTDAWQAEDAANAATHWGIRDTMMGRTDKPMRDAANTDLIGHAGKVLALWYMAGDAYEIDPISLQTLGKQRGVAASGGKISAHAKVDEISGELMFFDYGNVAPYMHYGVLGADGTLLHHVPITLPGPRLPHDMAVTEHYSMLHDLPLFHDHEAMKLGRHKIDFHPELPTRFGVIPRYGRSDEIRWFDFTPCFLYHTINAWEDGDEIVMVGCRYMPAQHADGSIDAQRTAKNIAELVMTARLWRWSMNLKTGAVNERCLDAEHNVEFPSCNASLIGRRTRYGYLSDQHATTALQWNGVRKCDLETGSTLSAWTDDADHSWYSEPWFAAADHSQAEDHGYVIAFQFNAATTRETLDIFDARDLSTGPIAQVAIPRHIPTGFHGCWVSAERVAGWNDSV